MKDNDVIVLEGIDGEEIEFSCVATINLDNNIYMILQPVELLEGMEEDEAIVFSVTYEGDTENYSIVLDDELIDRVFEEYYRLTE